MQALKNTVLKNRVPPPLVAGLFAFAMWAISFVVPTVEMNTVARFTLSAATVALGIFFCIAGVVSFRRAKTTVNPLKPEAATALVSSGIYGISRNPMYVGFALFLLAWVVYLSSPWLSTGIVGFVLYMNQFQIEPEERALKEIFGPEFISYQAKVRRWL
ncbi:isoprenylcysteine carboxylmethyltransferase family protein [Moritella sp.]|uniref:methyltransferase family protein n=1 Tax=Moritella sp. TaxID=78556 RepID=UPI001E0890B7|nr:isoprenylcysteine carboxylmethyltransferase family protein [Moritella sp.]MCJ8348858.1 isoprenylcysteine carboxylmethyltransferase family protein [Moritella sp.]NQZ38731.1 isoprenylcysteine carboxylmethyltransferase family protein [Moritella sp.]